MTRKEKSQTKQLNLRIDDSLHQALSEKHVSEFVREAIKEKLMRDKDYKQCPTCKGTGFVRK